MSTLEVIYLDAFDVYQNGNLAETRYNISTGSGLVDNPAGIEDTIEIIFETIKRCDLVVQEVVFKDPTRFKDSMKCGDYLKINLPCFPESGFARSRPLSEAERQKFCEILIKKIAKLPSIKEE